MLLLIINFRIFHKSKILRSENCYFDYSGCHDYVSRAWNGGATSSPMHAFSHYIFHTKTQTLN